MSIDMSIKCVMCHTEHVIFVEEQDVHKYQNGAYVQHAFPYLSADDRELIISGICGKCWNKTFPEE